MRYRSLKTPDKRSTISSVSVRSGCRLLKTSDSSSAPRNRLLGSSSYWDTHPREFDQRKDSFLTSAFSYSSSAFSWERASGGDHQSALINLSSNTDICRKALEFTPPVNNVLKRILCMYDSSPVPLPTLIFWVLVERSFVDETRRLTHSNSLLGPMTVPQPSKPRTRAVPISRAFHGSAHESPWKAPSLGAVFEAVPGSSDIHSEDANVLLVLSSFFTSSEKIPLDLLCCGATPRRRWTMEGGVEKTDTVRAGLAPELCSLLSDISRLTNALHELALSSTISKDSDQTYTLDGAVASRVRKRLSADHLSFWKRQALIVAYRAIPWKYIEPV